MTRKSLSALALASILTSFTSSSIADPKAHGASIVSYEPGAGAAPRFNRADSALGLPSESNPFGELTDPFNPPYGTNQIVSVGEGGHLEFRFNQPILNHPNHSGGFDFTVFGNAGFIITNEFDLTTFDWIGTPATDGSLFGSSTGEIVVSVSRNGSDYFVLNPALTPRIDSFPPTDGAGDPGVPVGPGLTSDDFAGATLEDIRALYAGSAGGASFDLDWALDAHGQGVFLPEIRFVRIDVLSGRAEIDAIAVVNQVAPGRR